MGSECGSKVCYVRKLFFSMNVNIYSYKKVIISASQKCYKDNFVYWDSNIGHDYCFLLAINNFDVIDLNKVPKPRFISN